MKMEKLLKEVKLDLGEVTVEKSKAEMTSQSLTDFIMT